MYLHINLPKVHLDNIDQTTDTVYDTNYNEKKTLLDNFNSYSSYIINAYRFLKQLLLLSNITTSSISTRLNNLFNNTESDYDFSNYEIAKSLIDNNDIINNTNIKSKIISIIDNSSLSEIQKLNLINIEIESIIKLIKLYHKNYYYDDFKLALDNKTNYDLKNLILPGLIM